MKICVTMVLLFGSLTALSSANAAAKSGSAKIDSELDSELRKTTGFDTAHQATTPSSPGHLSSFLSRELAASDGVIPEQASMVTEMAGKAASEGAVPRRLPPDLSVSDGVAEPR